MGIAPVNERVANAKEEDIKKEMENEIDKVIDGLDSKELDEYFDSLDEALKSSLGGSIKVLLKNIIDGNVSIGSEEILNYLIKAVLKNLSATFASLAGIAVLAIFYGMSEQLTSGFKRESTKQLVYWTVYGGIAVTIGISVSNLIIDIKNVITSISRLTEISVPIFATIITAIGGTGTVGFLEPCVTLFCGFAVKIIVTFVLPVFYAVTVFTIIGNMSDNIKLDKLSKALKSVGSWTLGLTFSIITAMISAQGLVGASIDTVSIKSAKFALSSYIPILGGYLAEGFDIVVASAVLIKNAFGLALLIAILLITLVPIIKTVCYSLALKLLSGLLEPVTDAKVTNLLYNTAQNLSLPIASCAGVGFMIFVIFMTVIGAFNAGVV